MCVQVAERATVTRRFLRTATSQISPDALPSNLLCPLSTKSLTLTTFHLTPLNPHSLKPYTPRREVVGVGVGVAVGVGIGVVVAAVAAVAAVVAVAGAS